MQTGTKERVPAWVLAQLGDTAGARQELETYLAIRRRGYISADGLAGVYAVLGDTVSAWRNSTRRSVTMRFRPVHPAVSHTGPIQTERYRRLIDRIGVVPP